MINNSISGGFNAAVAAIMSFTHGCAHSPVAGKQAGRCHSAVRSHSGLSKAVGNSAPPLGLPANHRRVSLDWSPPLESPSSPGCSADDHSNNLFAVKNRVQRPHYRNVPSQVLRSKKLDVLN